MVFKPGNNANPLGRPKRRSLLSDEYQAFCRAHQDEIQKVGKLVLEKAVIDKEPWAIKLSMEYFYPKPERSVSVTKEETSDTQVTDWLKTWSVEDKQTFLKVWLKNKRGVPAFESRSFGSTVEGEVKTAAGEVILAAEAGLEAP